MPDVVLIFQTDPESGKSLADYFTIRGDRGWQTAEFAEAQIILANELPDLVLIDIHAPDNQWLDLINLVHNKYPGTQIIATNKRPDLRREFLAKDLGVDVFLREPFSPAWIENALSKVGKGKAIPQGRLPKVRVPMRIKITFPYVVLALIFVFAAAFFVSRYILETVQQRFTNSLVETGKLSADWMVREEDRLLETLRLVAYTEGVSTAVDSSDANLLREICLPIAVNYQEEAVLIFDRQGNNILSVYHRHGGALEDYEINSGDASFADVEFLQKVLSSHSDTRGDKYAGAISTPQGEFFYVSGPIFNSMGNLVGAVLVGKSLSTLIEQIRQDTLGQITIYRMDGQPIVSTILVQKENYVLPGGLASQILQDQGNESFIRRYSVASIHYAELLGPWEVRGGEDIGIIGVALAENFVTRLSPNRRLQAFAIVALVFIGTIAVGLMIANQITRPLSTVVRASTEVAEGNLTVKVPSHGNDEVAVLASTFNYMVSGLQEGVIYRELLGRTVSPEVRETLRQSFASGGLRLEGQNAVATVLMSDIRDFTRLSEEEEPTTILNWLNEYFGELVPIIDAHSGVVDKFEGDAMLTFFGILPTPLPPEESAYQACLAATEMLEVVDRVNVRRMERGEPPLLTGIGVNTGSLTAGGLGTVDRINYTIIGDTVNTAQRIQEITRGFGENGIVISESVLSALGEHRIEFRFEPLGEHAFKGKQELLWLYRLWPVSESPSDVLKPEQGGL